MPTTCGGHGTAFPEARRARGRRRHRPLSAAHLLGRFHAGLADLEPARLTETLPHFHDPTRRLALLREAVAADPFGRVDRVTADIEAAAECGPARGTRRRPRRPPRTPRCAQRRAARQLPVPRNEAVCLVDLDTVMPTAWFWDVGDLVRSVSTRVAEDDPDPERHMADPQLVRAILDGYRVGATPALRGGRDEDRGLLELGGPLITYEQALRFLTDYIVGDIYYRTTRPDQNRDRARGQLALLASMQGTVGT